MSLSKPANFDQAQSVVPCDVCETESGEHYCTVCRQTLCNGCKKYHKKVAATKDHEVVPRVQMASAVASTTCSRYPNQTVAFQCGVCEVLVCGKCVTGDHQGHPMVELSKIYDDEKAKVEKDIRGIEQKTIPNLMKAIKEIQPKRDEYKKAIADIRKEMDDEITELRAKLDSIHSDRLKTLAETEAVGLKQFELVQQDLEERKRLYTDDVTTCKAKIESNNQVQFISYARTRGTKAQIDKSPVIKFSSYPQIQKVKDDNMEISDLLAKLNISAKLPCTITYKHIVEPMIISTFKSKSKGIPSICLTNEGNAWIGASDCREVRLMDHNGKVLRTRKTKSRPTCLAMTSSGDVIVCPHKDDSNTLMKLRADGAEVPLLDVSPSCCNGVSVTEDGDILICITGGRVLRCNRDGKNVRQLYDGQKTRSAIYAIELPDDNICITDDANKALVITDKTGKSLKQIMKPLGATNYDPWGLACDSVGNILSADYRNGRVYIISQEGEVSELVGKSHGIQKSIWLAVDSDDNVWIAQDDGHVKVVRYLA